MVLAQKVATIYFTKTHIADLKEVIRVEQSEGVLDDQEVARMS
jgi:hypothetical protein